MVCFKCFDWLEMIPKATKCSNIPMLHWLNVFNAEKRKKWNGKCFEYLDLICVGKKAKISNSFNVSNEVKRREWKGKGECFECFGLTWKTGQQMWAWAEGVDSNSSPLHWKTFGQICPLKTLFSFPELKTKINWNQKIIFSRISQ